MQKSSPHYIMFHEHKVQKFLIFKQQGLINHNDSCLTIFVSNYKLKASRDGCRGVPYSPPQKVLIFSYGYGAFWHIFIMGF
jgi:hypothetical protein